MKTAACFNLALAPANARIAIPAPAGQVAITLATLPPEVVARYASPRPLRTPRPRQESPPAEKK